MLETEILDVGAIEEFKSAPNLKGAPVPHDEVLENIKASAQFDIPILEKKENKTGSFIFCAGGPTLRAFLPEIKKRKEAGEFICSSNRTYDYLFENGIVSDACVVMDPKEIVETYIKNPQKETKFYIGVVCNPKVYQNLINADMDVSKLMIAYGMEDESDVNLMKEIYPHVKAYSYLVGGTMTGLRAMNFAIILGFLKIEYYGMDSCFDSNPKLIKEGDAGYEEAKARNKGNSYNDADTGEVYTIDESDEGGFFYAYSKPRSETIQIARTPDGGKFLTSPVFAHQAKQFIKWYDRMEGKVEIVVHGDNLTSRLLKCHKEAIQKAIAESGDRRWSKLYAEMQVQLHSEKHYGLWGSHDIDFVGKAILAMYVQKNSESTELLETMGRAKALSSKNNVSVLDYGCGSGDLCDAINRVFKIADVTKYDPFVEKYSKEPEGRFDIVTCFDVMEHVEIQYVPNTIKYIANKAKYIVLFAISCGDAIKTLPDGRNAHITQKSPQWWVQEINKQLQVVEAIYSKEFVMLACQTINANERLDKENI